MPGYKVLKNGVEVKLQRNALSVLEHPTGNEVDEDHDFDSSSGSDIGEKDHDFCKLCYFITDAIFWLSDFTWQLSELYMPINSVKLSACAANTIEFHKLSKPRVRQTKPWVSSASAKVVNRSSYRDVQSIIHTSQLVRNSKMGIDTNVVCSCLNHIIKTVCRFICN